MRPVLCKPAAWYPSYMLRAAPYTIRQAQFTSTSGASKEAAISNLSPRWLSDIKARIGKCIMFGINPAQTKEAGSILQEISTDWRELVAGSEGYLTAPQYRGLFRQEVVWGEMVAAPPV